MPFCAKCGKEIPEGAQFCSNCGTQVRVLPKVEKKDVSASEIIGGSFRPSMSFGNFLIVFVPMLLFFITLLQLMPQVLLLIAEKLPQIRTGTVDMATFVATLLRIISVVGASVLIYSLFGIYQEGVVIDNIGNKIMGAPKPYAQSLRSALSRYPSLFVAALLLTILSILVGIIPYVGWILRLIVVCIFFVVYQGIVLDRLGFADGFKRSYQYLRGYASPFIVVYILTTILAIIIAVIGLIPIGIAAVPLIPRMVSAFIPGEPSEILRALAELLASPTVYLSFVIACVIWTVNELYTTYGIPTKLYLEIREKNKEDRRV